VQYKLVQLGLINTTGTSNKAPMAHQKDKSKNPKKQHPCHNNKKNKGHKPSMPTSALDGDKGAKSKSKKTDKHCNFCGKDGHVESKCFKNIEALKVAMKKHNINIDSSSSSSHEHTLSASGFSFNVTSTSSFDEWLIDFRASNHMAKDKAIFSTFNEFNTNKIFVGDDRSLSVVGSGIIQVDNGHFNDILCVPSLSNNLLLVYQVTHLGEGKTIEFSPHQVAIEDLKYPKHILAIGIVNDITRLYKFDNFGSSLFPSIFVAHSDDLNKISHEQFGHLNYRLLQQLWNQHVDYLGWLSLMSTLEESPVASSDSTKVWVMDPSLFDG
jgi:hypothetical protein